MKHGVQDQTVIPQPFVAWGVSARALPGQSASGDLHLVKSFQGGMLLAVVDGVGHGAEATAAAEVAVRILADHPEELPSFVIRRCHAALMKTRGVVMTVGSLRPSQGTLTWLGVGNVEAALLRADPNARPVAERVVLRSGLVGYGLPELQATVVPIAPGDLIVFATDGISPAFVSGWVLSDPPQRIADCIMAKHFKQTDDALVLVARYLGNDHA